MLRFLTAGESHGKAQVAILEGIPAGLAITNSNIDKELKKRMTDAGRGGRGKIEKDEVKILSGIRFGKTLGSPIALLIENLDFKNWQEKMSTEDVGINQNAIKVTKPRPGHADLAGVLKYGFDDVRNVLERASARETVMRVAIGAICKKLIAEFGIKIASHTIQIGKVKIPERIYTFSEIEKVFTLDPETRCLNKKSRDKMKQEIINARMEKDTLGGIVEVIAHNIPVGLGSFVHYDQRLDGRIAQALMSIPSVKALEIGNAINGTLIRGSKLQDAIYVRRKKIYRKTNNMGGIEGGMTNGEDIICRVYHKPISTIYKPLSTVDIKTLKPALATVERSDICVVARAGIVSESMLAFVLTQALLEKFGGDNIKETKRNFNAYIKALLITI